MTDPMWEAFSVLYSPANPARREELEIYPKLRAAWEQWQSAWQQGCDVEREACATIADSVGGSGQDDATICANSIAEHIRMRNPVYARALLASRNRHAPRT